MKVIGEVVKEGRPTAERTVREWQESHPAGEPPGRKESGLHPRDRTCKAYCL